MEICLSKYGAVGVYKLDLHAIRDDCGGILRYRTHGPQKHVFLVLRGFGAVAPDTQGKTEHLRELNPAFDPEVFEKIVPRHGPGEPPANRKT